jgi:hypothetical protein
MGHLGKMNSTVLQRQDSVSNISSFQMVSMNACVCVCAFEHLHVYRDLHQKKGDAFVPLDQMVTEPD